MYLRSSYRILTDDYSKVLHRGNPSSDIGYIFREKRRKSNYFHKTLKKKNQGKS
ncbi:hypothetical protein LEP1GSC116_1853 [Leptospira interrogans serovar Icterohaemorrhagiae str. Verdun HP]|uniref:Uncharacterized protein n=1 Tax=Leptospira interrogans serovar Icterohaemorrhagiae str. Verdun HP TaxID=1049910 RepID=M6R4C3_LEPIR|nr:hypothetical protein LEP1GSC116_1853 [Leptospira interrogans serovar Icterohaemorrhagiae str. Verdun HP]